MSDHTTQPDSPTAGTDQMSRLASSQASAVQMYSVVVGVGVLCAIAIVIVYEATKPIIRENSIALRNQAILDVLPGAESSAAFRLNDSGAFEPVSLDDDQGGLVFAGYDGQHQLVGLAIEAEGMGYQDLVRVLYGYSLEREAIIGFRVLQSRETPGLGDRVESDAEFLANFVALDVRVDPSSRELLHPIQFVKSGQKASNWQIDGISGATITSRSIADMLSQNTQQWIPRVHQRRADFQFSETTDP